MFMTELINLWATPIYVSSVNLEPADRDFIRNLNYHRFDTNDGSCSLRTDLLNSVELQGLQAQIMSHVYLWTREHLAVADHVDWRITGSWSVRHAQGDHSMSHTHSNSLISGTVYIDCDPESGDLRFYRNNTHLNLWPIALDLDSSRYNQLNSKFWWIRPQVGTIVLFPSHVLHGVTANQSDQLRHCLAFNIWPKGTLGQGPAPNITKLDL